MIMTRLLPTLSLCLCLSFTLTSALALPPPAPQVQSCTQINALNAKLALFSTLPLPLDTPAEIRPRLDSIQKLAGGYVDLVDAFNVDLSGCAASTTSPEGLGTVGVNGTMNGTTIRSRSGSGSVINRSSSISRERNGLSPRQGNMMGMIGCACEMLEMVDGAVSMVQPVAQVVEEMMSMLNCAEAAECSISMEV